jgi:hypothetical protein
MDLKMGESHHLYEEVRSPRRPQAERIKLYLQLKSLWDNLPVRFHHCDRKVLIAARDQRRNAFV